MNLVALVGAITFPILERIPVVGDFAISPHGLGIAIGFGLGAVMMTRRAQKRGLGHTYVPDIPEAVQNLLTRAAVGAILGARFFYVLTHLDQFQDEPIRVLYAWEGGLTFLGGVTGAILLAIPYARSQGWRMSMLLDSAAPGIAFGLAIGRIGDLMIGDHIGAPTDFPLAWKCSANYWIRSTNSFGEVAPLPYPTSGIEPTAGCFDVAVHHTALYDFGATVVVLLVLLLMERRRWFDGAFIAAWVWVYGSLRIASDFARNDRTWAGLTGSQWSLVGAMALVAVVLLVRKPWRRQRWAWDKVFDHPWKVEGFDAEAFEIREGPLLVGAGARSRGAHAVLSAATVDLTPRTVVAGEATGDSPGSPGSPDAAGSADSSDEAPSPTEDEVASGARMRVPSSLFGAAEAPSDEASPEAPSSDEPWPAEPSPDEPSPDEPSPDEPSPVEASPVEPSPVEPSPDDQSPDESPDDEASGEASPMTPWPLEASPPKAAVSMWDPPVLESDVEPSPDPDPARDEESPDPEPWPDLEPSAEPEPVWDETPLQEPAPIEPVRESAVDPLPVERPRPSDPSAGPRMARRRDHPGSGA